MPPPHIANGNLIPTFAVGDFDREVLLNQLHCADSELGGRMHLHY